MNREYLRGFINLFLNSMEIGGKESIMTKRKRDREIKLQENLYEDEDLNTKDIKDDINRIRYISNKVRHNW